MPETIPPVMLDAGMFCAAPTQLVPASRSEQLFNWFYSPAGALVRRPGSTFYARLGRGAVLGLHEHTFETVQAGPVLAGVVADPLPRVWALAQDGEPAGTGGFAFVPDVRHAADVFPIPARATDRFQFASLFDTVYLAGSTLVPGIRMYEYTERRFRLVPNLPVTGVFAHRQRLYGYGSRFHPNYLYPSGYADPETFNPDLAIQVGGSNARIVLGLPALNRVILFTSDGVWQYDGYAVENGDLDLREVDLRRSIVGPLAACAATDGYVYWLDPRVGPCRWTTGLAGAETEFAKPMAEVFPRMHPRAREQAVVFYDPVHDAVHFTFALGDGENDYTASWFPGRGWTHSASSADTALVGSVRLPDGSTRYTGGRGVQPGASPEHTMHTCALVRIDPLTGDAQVLAADADGYVWCWTRGGKDKARGTAERPGWDFVSLWRSGTFDLANLERVAMVHRVSLKLEAPGDWRFDFRVERDYSRLFHRTHTRASDEYPGKLGESFALDGSPLARAEPLPVRDTRLPLWRHGIAKMLRFELETRDGLVLLGLEFSLSRTAR
jgi:hypothetical protein